MKSSLHGRINDEGSPAWWREQEDHCNPAVETLLGRPLACTRFEGAGDLSPVNHVSTMERIRGCGPLTCGWRPQCRSDPRSRALVGTLDECTPGFACKLLLNRKAVFWDPADFFDAGVPLDQHGLAIEHDTQATRHCLEVPRISSIDPASGVLDGGTLVTIHGTGFGAPARCRFGWLDTVAHNVTAHQIVCAAPSLNATFSLERLGLSSFGIEIILNQPVRLEVRGSAA